MANKVLVTGAAGFIGSNVVRSLSSRGVPTVAVDGLLGGLYPAGEKKQRFAAIAKLSGVTAHHLDIRHDDLSVIEEGVTHVINEAAMPGLGPSWSDFDLYATCNLSAVARLIDVAKNWPLQKFIQISTSSVYGKLAVGDETLPTLPVSPYGATKLAAEHLALAHWRDSGFPVSVLRYFSVYGPGQRPDMAYRKFIARALAQEPIDVFGDGSQSRSNTYIDDCVAATVSALEKAESGEIYNISGGTERSLLEALEIIEKEAGRKLSLRFHPRARGDQDRTMGDSQKAVELLGLSHTITLEEGLARQVKWQRDAHLF